MKLSTCELEVSEDLCVRTCGYDGDMFTCLQTLKSCIFSGKAYVFWQGHRHGDERMRALPASMHMIHLTQLTQILDHFFKLYFHFSMGGEKAMHNTDFFQKVSQLSHTFHTERESEGKNDTEGKENDDKLKAWRDEPS